MTDEHASPQVDTTITVETLLEAILPVLAEDARDGPEDDMRWFRLGAAYSIANRPKEFDLRNVELF